MTDGKGERQCGEGGIDRGMGNQWDGWLEKEWEREREGWTDIKTVCKDE